MIIAIAGKGGVGKTTIASLLVRYLVTNKNGSVLGVDADPNSNLGDFLGFKPKQDIGQLIDDIARNPNQVPVEMGKDQYIDYSIQTSLEEGKGFDMIVMGKPEGPGCYCYVNIVLRRVLTNIMSKYDYVVVDNEAGFEHLSRRTVKDIDTLIIVSDPTEIGMKAARRIMDLAQALAINFKRIFLIVNGCEKSNYKVDIKKINDKIDFAGAIKKDNSLPKIIVEKGLFGLSQNKEIVQESDKIFDKIVSAVDYAVKTRS